MELLRKRRMHMRMNLTKILFVAVCVNVSAICVSTARADILANISSTGDGTLFQGGVNTSLGDPGIFVGTDSTSSFKYGLMAFNISAIPSYATITGVTLDLCIGIVAGSGGKNVTNSGSPRSISLYDESQAWGASTNVVGSTAFAGAQGVAPNPGDATWDDASYNSNSSLATPWNSGMPANISSTSVALATTSGIQGTTSAEVQWSSAGLAAEVQGWVNNPASDNGLVLVNSNSSSAASFLGFWGAQGAANANNGFAPDLAVTYTVPEPVSLSLVGVVAPILLCRRQRRTPN
jgi:hypothetical protein